jgi:hypothetical protein
MSPVQLSLLVFGSKTVTGTAAGRASGMSSADHVLATAVGLGAVSEIILRRGGFSPVAAGLSAAWFWLLLLLVLAVLFSLLLLLSLLLLFDGARWAAVLLAVLSVEDFLLADVLFLSVDGALAGAAALSDWLDVDRCAAAAAGCFSVVARLASDSRF